MIEHPTKIMKTSSTPGTDPVHVAATTMRPRSSPFRVATAVVRVLMGAPLVVFGLNGFLNFIPPPQTPLPEGATAFLGALVNSGYMMQLIAVTHLIVGVLLLINRFVPLALVLFAPFIVNSIAFHIFLEPTGRFIAGVFLLFELYLAWVYRAAFRPLLVAHPQL